MMNINSLAVNVCHSVYLLRPVLLITGVDRNTPKVESTEPRTRISIGVRLAGIVKSK